MFCLIKQLWKISGPLLEFIDARMKEDIGGGGWYSEHWFALAWFGFNYSVG